MAIDDQRRWDQKHATGGASENPSAFLVEILDSGSWNIPRGRALDIACGKGRNAHFLARMGFEVEGIDISAAALAEAESRAREESLRIAWRQADLETITLPRNHYDLIVEFNYLERSSVPKIKNALKTGGFVIFETFLIGQEAMGHPKNPAYLLGHNELLELFHGLRVLYYREGKRAEGGATAMRAGIFAQKLF